MLIQFRHRNAWDRSGRQIANEHRASILVVGARSGDRDSGRLHVTYLHIIGRIDRDRLIMCHREGLERERPAPLSVGDLLRAETSAIDPVRAGFAFEKHVPARDAIWSKTAAEDPPT